MKKKIIKLSFIFILSFCFISIVKADDCVSRYANDAACGTVYFIPKQIPFFTNLLMNLIKIFTPIILIIKGTIDLFKAITQNSEKDIISARSKFFKRLIPAAVVFLVVLFVQFIFGFIATQTENNTLLKCIDCFLNNKCDNTPEEEARKYCESIGENGQGGSGQGENGQGGSGTGEFNYQSIVTDDQIKLGNHIVEVGRDLVQKYNNDFVYLYPGKKDKPEDRNKREDLGCYPLLIKNKRCTTKDYQSCSGENGCYFGGDCNAFVSWVIKNATTLPTSGVENSQYVSPSASTNKWISEVGKYVKQVAVIEDGLNNIEKIKSSAIAGDILGRVCQGGSTHVGIYTGDGTALENCGSCSDDNGRNGPIVERNLKSFIRITEKKCTITVLRIDAKAYKEYIEKNGGGTTKDLSGTPAVGNTCGSDVIYKGTKYSLTDEQKRTVAAMIKQEYGGNLNGMKAVASQMANNYEKWKNYYKQCAVGKTLYEYVRISDGDCQHYDSRTLAAKPTDDANALKAVEDVLINGNRTLPLYVDEFDMYPSDIVQEYRKNDVSEFIKDKTYVKGNGSGEGYFYCITETKTDNYYDANLFYYSPGYRKSIDSSYTQPK